MNSLIGLSPLDKHLQGQPWEGTKETKAAVGAAPVRNYPSSSTNNGNQIHANSKFGISAVSGRNIFALRCRKPNLVAKGILFCFPRRNFTLLAPKGANSAEGKAQRREQQLLAENKYLPGEALRESSAV